MRASHGPKTDPTLAIFCNSLEIIPKDWVCTCGSTSAVALHSTMVSCSGSTLWKRRHGLSTGALALMLRLLTLLSLLAPNAALAFDRHQHVADLPRVFGDRDPSDRDARVPRATYQSVTAATKTYRPVAPLPWDELNRRVTPRPKQDPAAVPKRK